MTEFRYSTQTARRLQSEAAQMELRWVASLAQPGQRFEVVEYDDYDDTRVAGRFVVREA